MRLLLVEDDVQIAGALAHALRRAGYAVDVVGDGLAADSALELTPYDLAILDVGLPKLDGFAVLDRLRRRLQLLPVIVLTARDELSERVRGLDLGADDYVLKPFDLEELLARVRAALRRASGQPSADVEIAKLRFNSAQRRFQIGDEPLDLPPREYGVLEALVLKRGKVVSKSQLQEHLCDWSSELSDAAIEVHIHRVRKKLEHAGIEIRTVRGFGYLLRVQQTDPAA
jgi:DNA-binding response OmpR family regulator